nr:EAL domain-containing protein [uncultured Sulfurimonas sp.]
MDLNTIKDIRTLANNMSVLYVEDELNVREPFSKILYKMFDFVDIACDGEEAISKYNSKDYDLVITDLNMPNLNGVNLVDAIKEKNNTQSIIVISAGKNVEEILKLVECGISGYLLKPLDIKKMFKLVHDTVRKIYVDRKITNYNEEMKEKLNKKLIDPLTHLYNYTHLVDTLDANSKKFAILININGLHLINEGYSYEHGNEFLFKYAKILKNKAEIYDYTAFRISGDEFVLLKNKITSTDQELEEEAISLKEEIKIQKLNLLDAKNINVSVTLAIANSDGNILEQLYKTLDHAKKYALKYAIHKDIPDNSQIAKEILLVKNMLHTSIENDLIVPFFQPIVSKTGELKHEVLMRIKNFKQEDIYFSPISFMQIAKEYDYYNEISRILILKALDFAITSKGVFTLNFSYLDMVNQSFLDTLEKKIIENNLGSRLVFEIVESEIIDDMDIFDEFLTRFRAHGILVAIDDFGSGYSNFSYIFSINPDFIKLDGSIIKNILEDEKIHSFVESMIQFAHKFDIKVIAEFVSSEELYLELLKMGVDAMQGYYLGRPSQNIQESKYA